MVFVQTTHSDRHALSARPGSVITVEDRFGRLAEYELLDDHAVLLARHRVRLDSSTGLALNGSRTGDVVWFPEHDGRPRRFIVHHVTLPPGPRGS